MVLASAAHSNPRKEDLAGLPNKQVVMRLSVSDSTLRRSRRRAIAILAQELAGQRGPLPDRSS
jgi:hypothetical protein